MKSESSEKLQVRKAESEWKLKLVSSLYRSARPVLYKEIGNEMQEIVGIIINCRVAFRKSTIRKHTISKRAVIRTLGSMMLIVSPPFQVAAHFYICCHLYF